MSKEERYQHWMNGEIDRLEAKVKTLESDTCQYKFNLNHHVKVKLYEEGYKHQMEVWNITLPDVNKETIEYFKSKADKDGYVSFQMHSFIDTFGDVIGMGHRNICDNNLIIESSELERL